MSRSKRNYYRLSILCTHDLLLIRLSLTEYPAPNRYGPAAYINVQKAISHGSSAHIVLIDGEKALVSKIKSL